MKLLMISGDRSILQGKRGAFWYTLEEFSKHWERIDVLCPRVFNPQSSMVHSREVTNVHFHTSPYGLVRQPWWILEKGHELITAHHHDAMTVHEFPPFYNGMGARWLHRSTKVPYMTEVHHIVGDPTAASVTELIGRWMSRVWLPRGGTTMAKTVRVVNSDVRKTLTRWGVPAEKIALVPSLYLDPRILTPDPSVPKTYDVVTCGRLVANKGMPEVLRAVALLPGVTLLVIGDGPMRLTLERLAATLGITDRVTFVGWLPTNDDVYRAMQSAKVFVMASKSEGGPRVLFEAMALGLAVIATPVGQAPYVIDNTVNGLITSGDEKHIAQHIQKLLTDDIAREKMARRARGIAERFDRSTLVKAYADAVKACA